ncbi:hypothetical protein S245_034389 [Arachis hypogaea]
MMLKPSSCFYYSSLLLLLTAAAFVIVLATVTYDGRSLIIDGQHRILFSGSIHYSRSTPEIPIHTFILFVI